MNFKILLLIFLLSSSYILVAQETIVDTLYSIPELDGGIGYVIDEDIYRVDNSYGGFYVGDTFGSISGSVEFARGYLCFPLPNIPENYSLNSAILFVYQYFSIGNDIEFANPIFNIGNEEINPPCLIEDIDYGNYLDAGDFNLPALHPADTISYTSEQDWRSLEITEWVLDDLNNDRQYNQTRLRLSLDYDDDHLMDAIGFLSGNTIAEEKPYIVYQYSHNNAIDEDSEVDKISDFIINLYPNPISNLARIDFNLPQQKNIDLELYNIKGQKVINLYSDTGNSGRNVINIDMSGISNGIYLLNLKSNNNILQSKKIIVLD